jgi:hypothetical protein
MMLKSNECFGLSCSFVPFGRLTLDVPAWNSSEPAASDQYPEKLAKAPEAPPKIILKQFVSFNSISELPERVWA